MSRRTPRETREQIVEAIRGGASNRKAAEAAGVSPTTVHRIRGELRAGEPFSGRSQGSPAIPPAQYSVDQPPPAPTEPTYDPRYHGHTFRAAVPPPLAIGGWDLERIRDAITQHDQGNFLESSELSLAVTRFGPVYAALGQSLAPALALPRHVKGGESGLARIVREEIEAQIAPQDGLVPSPYFPPSLWGSTQYDVATMGFSVWQHVHGDDDPDTGVRPVYTRRWPTWAVQEQRWRQTYVALTTDGPVDIHSGDGKFTLIGDTVSPHFDGAIRALGTEVIDGLLVKQARASYIDRYGNPKWVAIMPDGIATRSPQGDDFFSAVQTIQGPDGVGVFPYGSTYKVEQMTAQQSTVFKDALDNIWQYVAAIILGTDGTMSPSTGVYSAPIFAGVRRDIVARRLMAMVRAVNAGHISPYLAFNYAMSIALEASWKAPVLEIPLPDPQADDRIKSYAERRLKLCEIVDKERSAGFLVTEERVNELARELDVPAPTLAPAGENPASFDLAPTDVATFIRGREGRAAYDLQPFGDERDEMTVFELRESAKAKTEEAKADAEADAEIKVEEEAPGGDDDAAAAAE